MRSRPTPGSGDASSLEKGERALFRRFGNFRESPSRHHVKRLFAMIRNLKAATRFLSVSILMGSLIASVPDVSRAQSETPVPERNVHEEQSDQAPSRPGIVTIKTSSTESLASVEKQLKQNETNRIVSAVSKYLAAAKKDYSPRYPP